MYYVIVWCNWSWHVHNRMFSNFLATHFGAVPSWPLSYHFHITIFFFSLTSFISKVYRRHLFNCMLCKMRNQLKSCVLKEREREKKRERNLSVSISCDYITIFFFFLAHWTCLAACDHTLSLLITQWHIKQRERKKDDIILSIGRNSMSRIFIYIYMFDNYYI